MAKSKKRVLFLSIHDYAGSGHRYSEAVNRNGRYQANSLKFFGHKFGYETGLCIDLSHKVGALSYGKRVAMAQEMVDNADILHFKGDFPVLKQWGPFAKNGAADRSKPLLEIPVSKPIVITASGSSFRRHLSNKRLSQATFSMDIMKRYTDVRTVTTPDLNYPDFDAEWLPFPFDVSSYSNNWLEGDHGVITVGHTPSNRGTKGTNKILLPAFAILKRHCQAKGIKVSLEIVEGVSYRECLARKKNFSIFWDQCGFGFYGNALVEACAAGVPSMAWLSEHSLGQMSHFDRNNLVVQSFEQTPESCAKAMIEIVESDMCALSKRTIEWAHKTHSYEAVGEKLSSIYDRII